MQTSEDIETIFENENFRIIFREGQSHFLWLTFDFWGQPSDHFWGQSAAEHHNYSVLNFKDKRNLWFSGIDSHFSVVQKILDRFPTRLAMGVSMGGYAAIRYSAALKSDITLGISPQYSIDPQVIADWRYIGWYNIHIHSNVTIKPENISGRIYILSDPNFRLDRLHQDLLANTAAIVHIPTYYTGHFATIAYQDTEGMGSVISSLFAEDVKSLKTIAYLGKKASVERPCGLVCAAWEKNEKRARALLARYRSRVSPVLMQQMLVELARDLEKRGNFESAISAMQAAIPIREGQYGLYGELSAMMKAHRT